MGNYEKQSFISLFWPLLGPLGDSVLKPVIKVMRLLARLFYDDQKRGLAPVSNCQINSSMISQIGYLENLTHLVSDRSAIHSKDPVRG